MKRKIAILILLIIGIICALIGWHYETTEGTSTKSIILLLGGIMLFAGILGVMKDDLFNWLYRLIHKK